MSKSKKIIILVVVILLLIGGGVFYWHWQGDVRELNKNLPEGIKVVKNLAGEYSVVNKIDGYKFKIPEDWDYVEEINYYGEEETEGLSLSGPGDLNQMIGIGLYKLDESDVDLEPWVKETAQKYRNTKEFSESQLEEMNLPSEQIEFSKKFIKNYLVIKVKLNWMMGMLLYYFETGPKVCEISGFSEEAIDKIILSGEW